MWWQLRQVAFVRVDTQTILTIDDAVITRNARVSIRRSVDSQPLVGNSSNNSGNNSSSGANPPLRQPVDFKRIRNQWQLMVKDVQAEDAGAYMCQLNTQPMTSRVGYLHVTGLLTMVAIILLMAVFGLR